MIHIHRPRSKNAFFSYFSNVMKIYEAAKENLGILPCRLKHLMNQVLPKTFTQESRMKTPFDFYVWQDIFLFLLMQFWCGMTKCLSFEKLKQNPRWLWLAICCCWNYLRIIVPCFISVVLCMDAFSYVTNRLYKKEVHAASGYK